MVQVSPMPYQHVGWLVLRVVCVMFCVCQCDVAASHFPRLCVTLGVAHNLGKTPSGDT